MTSSSTTSLGSMIRIGEDRRRRWWRTGGASGRETDGRRDRDSSITLVAGLLETDRRLSTARLSDGKPTVSVSVISVVAVSKAIVSWKP